MSSIRVSSISSGEAVYAPIVYKFLPRDVNFQDVGTLTIHEDYPNGMEERAMPHFIQFIEPHLKKTRYKKGEDFPAFVRLFSTGCLAVLCWRLIRYSRRNESILNRVIRAAVKAEFFREELGKPGGKHHSRLQPTARVFLELIDSDPWRLFPPPGEEGVRLCERGSKRPKEISRAETCRAQIEERMALVNKVNADHVFAAERVCVSYRKSKDPDDPRPIARTHVLGVQQLRSRHVARFTEDPDNEGMLSWHGRCYTPGPFGHQQLRKVERVTIRIDGRPSVELDYSAMHPRLLYHRENLNYVGDPYHLWGSDTTPAQRSVAKLLLNTAINARSKRAALEACINRVRTTNTEGVAKRGKALSDAIDRKAAMIEAGVWGPTIATTRSNLEELYGRLETLHAPIAKYLTSDSGVRLLMPIDGKIARDVMYHFAQQEKPILSVHDSFIVLSEHKEELFEAMFKYYRKYANGFEPTVR